MSATKKSKSDASKSYPKLSVVSAVVTSTPIRGDFVPEDISLSDNDTLTSNVEEGSKTWEDVSMVTDIASSSSSSEAEEEVKLKTRKRVANVGRDWKHFKPRDSTSLYYLVLSETGFTKDLAESWLNIWARNVVDGTSFMLQFFLDVAGYQEYNIMEIYGTPQFTKQNILKELENNCPLFLADYTYLLNTNSEWSKNAKEKIYIFLQEVVACADRREYNYSMFNELFKFLKIMSHSIFCTLKHTSFVFAIQFLVSLSKLHRKCKEEVQRYCKNKNLAMVEIQKMKHLQMRQEILRKFLMSLFSIVLDNYSYQDANLKDMRRECSRCLYIALHNNPEFFFEMNAIDIFTNLLSDSNGEVRVASLSALRKLMKSKKCYPYLKRKASNIFSEIFTSRLDVDYNVAIAAVDVLTDSIKLYKNAISKTILNAMFIMVYNKYYPLASAAGRFLYTYISQAHNDEIEKIKKIIKFSTTQNVDHLLPLLVEALMDCASELHSYKTITRLLLTDTELSFQERLRLLQILCHTVIQIVTGRASLLRTKHRDGPVEGEAVEQVTELILTKIPKLLEIYCEETDSLKSILEMLLAFTYQDASAVQYRSSILQIIKTVAQYFINSNDSDILDMTSKLLFKICNDYSPLRSNGLTIVQTISKECEDRYKQFINDEDMWEDPSFEEVILQLQHLFKYHNISVTFEVKNVENLFSTITRLNEKLLSCNLSCGFYYQRQVFRNALQEILTDEEGPESNFEELKQTYSTFLEVCFDHIRSDKSKIIAQTAYECICDFHIAISDEIYEHKSTYPAIMSLKTVKLPTEQEFLLREFFNNYIFDASVSESKGTKLLGKFADCILKSALPMYLLPYILIHYNSFYDKYGELFNHILTQVAVIGAKVVGVVIGTAMIIEFQKLSGRPAGNIGEESMYIKKLAMQFSKFLSKPLLIATLQHAIDFAVEEEDNLMFFHYLNHFCHKLTQDLKSIIFTYITNTTNYGIFQGNKYVFEFVQFLQVNKRLKTSTVQGRSRRRQSTTSTSSTESGLFYQSGNVSEDIDT